MNGDSQVQVLERLGTLMAGAQVESLPMEPGAAIAAGFGYAFALPNGDHLVAIWRDVDITDEDIGLDTTIKLPVFSEYAAYGVDVLNGFQQPLNARTEGENLVIPGLQLRDYPLLVRLAPPRKVFVPLILKYR